MTPTGWSAARKADRLSDNRDATVDVARGVLMILVIYAHALEVLFNKRPDGGFSVAAFQQWQLIFSFHMPAFFFVSGMANKNIHHKDLRAVAISSLRLVLFAYLSHLIAWLPVTLARWGGQASDVEDIFRSLVLPLARGGWFSLVVTWFLVALAGVQLIAALWVQNGRKTRIALTLAVAVLFIGLDRYHNFFQIRAWWVGLLFFLLGREFSTRGIQLPLIVAPLAVLAVTWLAPLNQGCELAFLTECEVEGMRGEFGVLMISGLYGFIPLFIVTALLGTFGAIALAGWLARSYVAASVQRLGRETLALLLLNGFFLVTVQPYLAKSLPSSMGHGTATALCLGTVLFHLAFRGVAAPVSAALEKGSATIATWCETFLVGEGSGQR